LFAKVALRGIDGRIQLSVTIWIKGRGHFEINKEERDVELFVTLEHLHPGL
jgi:hypothetical protein